MPLNENARLRPGISYFQRLDKSRFSDTKKIQLNFLIVLLLRPQIE